MNNIAQDIFYWGDKMEQQLTLLNRKSLTVDRVEEIISYSDELIVLFTKTGDLRIRGKSLNIISAFANDSDTVEIEGTIRSLYFEDNEEIYQDNIINKIFR